MLKFMLPGKLSWNKSGRTAQGVRMEREDHVDPSLAPALGFIFPRWMDSAPSQLSLHAGPSGGDFRMKKRAKHREGELWRPHRADLAARRSQGNGTITPATSFQGRKITVSALIAAEGNQD